MHHRRPVLRTALLLALTCVHAVAAPTGGVVVSGIGGIVKSGATTTVTQGSDRLSLNWATFNVGKTETVRFNQPSASSLAVNRIADVNGSRIQGNLQANGQVFLINPNGIIFGSTAQVNVGGLVASTLDISDADLANGTRRFSGSGTGAVSNAGTITANGGYIALLGGTVTNTGTLSANGGTVALGAGNRVALDFAGDRLVSLAVEENTVAAQAANGGLIRADGGQVLLSAGARDSLVASVVNNTGVIEARTVENRDGRIILLGGMTAGTTNVAGTLDASAPDGGNGGFIETSAAQVKVANSARITTAAASGQTGTWLIDPTDFTIAATGGDISGAVLESQLADNNVVIESASGATEGNGDIFVNDTVSWSANNLTLSAGRNIAINANLNASGTASLDLLYGQDAIAAGNTAHYTIAAGNTVSLPSGNSLRTQLGSDGELNTYTVVNTIEDLQGISYAPYVALGADIDAAATATWNNYGDDTYAGFAPLNFYGTFAGLGHTITGLTINRPNENNVGLFGSVSGATLRDFNVTGGQVAGGSNYVGGLVGYIQGGTTLSNVTFSGTVSGQYYYVGGLVGFNQGSTLINSAFSGAVSGRDYVGGLVGYSQAGTTLSNVTFSGTVSGQNYVGGLMGYNQGGLINNSASSAAVSGGEYVGGLVGYNYSTLTYDSYQGYEGDFYVVRQTSTDTIFASVIDSTHTGSVTGVNYVGGLIGWDVSGLVTGSTHTGSVTGTSAVGGLIGQTNFQDGRNVAYSYDLEWNFQGYSVDELVRHETTQITQSVNQGTVSGENNVGGLIGYNQSGAITQSTNEGAVSGGNQVGGLIGYNQSGTIDDSRNEGTVTATKSGAGNVDIYAGGLVGYNYRGTITNSVNTGAVHAEINATGQDNYYDYATWYGWEGYAPFWQTSGEAKVTAGGLVGYNEVGTISGSENSGAVTATATMTAGTFHDDGYTNSVSVSATAYAGGLVGYNNGSAISDSVNTAAGQVSASANVVLNTEEGRSFDSVSTTTTAYAGGAAALNQGGNFYNNTTSQYETHFSALTNVANSGAVTASSSGSTSATLMAGGLVASSSYAEISQSGNTGAVSVTTSDVSSVTVYAGGLIGRNEGGAVYEYSTSQYRRIAANVTDVTNEGAVTVELAGGDNAQVHAGGLVGRNDSGNLDQATNTGAVTVGADVTGSVTVYAGGLAGYSAMSTINGSTNTGAVDVDITTDSSMTIYAGGVAGNNEGGDVYDYNLGLYDHVTAAVTDVSNSGTVTVAAYGALGASVVAGGIMGRNYFGSLNEATNTGAVLATVSVADVNYPYSYLYAGGLVGQNHASFLSAVTNTGSVNAAASGGYNASMYVGGLAGYSRGDSRYDYTTGQYIGIASTVTDVSNAGAIAATVSGALSSEQMSVGGIIGYNESDALSQALNTGVVTFTGTGVGDYSRINAGGIVGRSSGSIENARNEAAVNVTTDRGQVYAGGLAGYTSGDHLSDVSNTAAVGVTVTDNPAYDYGVTIHAGGLVGYTDSQSVTDAYNRGAVSVTITGVNQSTLYVGGLLGLTGSYTNYAFNEGAVDVSITGGSYTEISAGGFAGYNNNDIGLAYNAGAVSVSTESVGQVYTYTGGLVGRGNNSLSTAYNTGALNVAVTGAEYGGVYAGGLVGYQSGGYIIETSYASGVVTVSSDNTSVNRFVGGLAGYDDGMSYAGVFWNTTTSGQEFAVGGSPGQLSASGLTTEQLQSSDFLTLAQAAYVEADAHDGNSIVNGWDASFWSPTSPGYASQLYALTPVIVADGGSKGYGETTSQLGTITHGGTESYRFGPSDDGIAGDSIVTSAANAGVGSVVVNGTVMSDEGVVYRVIGTNLTITARAVELTANDQSRVYGDANPELTYTLNEGSLVEGDNLSLTTEASAISNVGVYGITLADLAVNANYAITFNEGALNVTQREISVAANDQTKVAGSANPAFTYTITDGSLINGDVFSGSLATPANGTSAMGTYAINQGTFGNANYAITFVEGVLTVTAAPVIPPVVPPVTPGPAADVMVAVKKAAQEAQTDITPRPAVNPINWGASAPLELDFELLPLPAGLTTASN